MGLLSRVSTVSAPPRLRSAATPGPMDDYWYAPRGLASLTLQSPDVALALSHVYSAVATISDDIGTMTCHLYRQGADGGRELVDFRAVGIGQFARALRWRPNPFQTAKAFWSTLVWAYLLRPAAYAELYWVPGTTDIPMAMVPRHPDRVRPVMRPDGRPNYKVREPNGLERDVLWEDMLVLRNTSPDGLNALSRIDYGARAVDTGLALQDYTHTFFRKGASGALLATYKGSRLEDETEAQLHASISRFVSGTDNAGGIMLVDQDIDVRSLGVEPQKAELSDLKNLSGRDIARLFKIPPHKLGIEGTQTYASQVQSALEYVTGCLMPIVVEIEQALQLFLIRDNGSYFAKFNMDYLLRADTLTRMQAYAVAIRNRIMRPSEARELEDLPPDPELDRLSAEDFKPGGGARSTTGGRPGGPDDGGDGEAPESDGTLERVRPMALAAAERVVRRETSAIATAAKKYARDADEFRRWAGTFYADHGEFVSDALAMDRVQAAAYCAEHYDALCARGLAVVADWEADEPARLAERALTLCRTN